MFLFNIRFTDDKSTAEKTSVLVKTDETNERTSTEQVHIEVRTSLYGISIMRFSVRRNGKKSCYTATLYRPQYISDSNA